jgi:3-phosphoshikimate 1-carboxyvinyltransferase
VEKFSGFVPRGELPRCAQALAHKLLLPSLEAVRSAGLPVARLVQWPGDLVITASALHGVEPDPARAPSMIDEYPVAFIAAALAHGRSVFRGLEELRVKESDRIAAMAAGLRAIGVAVEELDDGIVITGSGGAPLNGGGPIATHLDHRIAMSFAVAGLVSTNGVTIDDMRPVATSFPTFTSLLTTIGAIA